MKKILAILIALMLLLAAGIVWVLMSFHIIDGQLYAKNVKTMDLRNREISVAHYEALTMRLPDCRILWNIPFQGATHSSDSKELILTDLIRDVQMLPYFEELETLDARGCEDLSRLPVLQALCPDVTILAQVSIQGQTLPYDTKSVVLNAITEEELALLPILSQLELVEVTDRGDPQNFRALRDYCEANAIPFRMTMNGEAVTAADRSIILDHVTDAQVELLKLMPWLERIHMPEPEAAADNLISLRDALPGTTVTWEKTVLGVTFSDDATQIDLTDVVSRADGAPEGSKTAYEYGLDNPVMCDREEVQSSVKINDSHPLPDRTLETEELIAQLEAAMEYFPETRQLMLVGTWLDNEAMSRFRERHREDYKVVWSVQIGNLATRTDAKLFMPTKFMVTAGSIADWHAYNLRYCEEIVSMDIGHMSISELDFVQYMPNLTYLDIALNHIVDLSPMASCKNLKFLVMHSLSMPLDYTPLQGCTALEDLNIADNPGDVSAVFEMKQLKNLWITGLGYDTYNRAKAALPDTNIGYNYNNPNSGWRSLPNYFKMRDALLMFYMS